jgi:hypothetical protein
LHQAESFEPVEKVLLEKGVELVIVIKLRTTPLKMLDPVETCILSLWRKTFLNSTAVDLAREGTWSVQTTDISFETCAHKLQAVPGQCCMCHLLIYPEVLITASLFVEEEVAE